jgi:hypothetical protein
MARALGWFSIGLGLAELCAPEFMERITGVRRPNVLRAYGVREIVTGVGVLSCDKPAEWMWGRVAGDVMDLATLGEPLTTGRHADQNRACVAAAAVAGVLVLDLLAAVQLTAAKHLEG